MMIVSTESMTLNPGPNFNRAFLCCEMSKGKYSEIADNHIIVSGLQDWGEEIHRMIGECAIQFTRGEKRADNK